MSVAVVVFDILRKEGKLPPSFYHTKYPNQINVKRYQKRGGDVSNLEEFSDSYLRSIDLHGAPVKEYIHKLSYHMSHMI